MTQLVVTILSVLIIPTSLLADEAWKVQQVLSYKIHFTDENAAEIPSVSKVLTDFHDSFIQVAAADPQLFSNIRIEIYLYPAASTEVSVHYISLAGGSRNEGQSLSYVG